MAFVYSSLSTPVEYGFALRANGLVQLLSLTVIFGFHAHSICYK